MSLPFTTYLMQTRRHIQNKRCDLQSPHAQTILEANAPFECTPETPTRTGALLVHGLLDTPFSLRDIGEYLKSHHILSRAILLPGHGTTPADLLSVHYTDWIQAIRYGVASFQGQVDHLFIVGYSTGAALAIYHALQHPVPYVKGLVLLAPAIKIRAHIRLMSYWHRSIAWLTGYRYQWFSKEPENDYAKYQSIPFNAITQVDKLTRIIRRLYKKRALTIPIFMAMSDDDETISSQHAMRLFTHNTHPNSQLLLYTGSSHLFQSPHIKTRLPQFAPFTIQHYSHTALPFSPQNKHYGLSGDFVTHTPENCIYGAYNAMERWWFDTLYQFKLIQKKRCVLSFNPDFTYMASQIVSFITP